MPLARSNFSSLPVGLPLNRFALVAPKAFQAAPGFFGSAGGASAVSVR